MSVLPKQGPKNEAKKSAGNQGQVCAGNRTDAGFVFKFRKVFVSLRPNWVREIRGANNNHYLETILFNYNNNNKEQQQVQQQQQQQSLSFGDDPLHLVHI